MKVMTVKKISHEQNSAEIEICVFMWPGSYVPIMPRELLD